MQNFEYTTTIDTDILINILSYASKDTDISDIVFLDIETTGFSSKGSVCYLIGTAYIVGNQLICRQIFSDTPDDESAMLSAFVNNLDSNSTIITYNGSNFDIPFIETRCKRHNICTDTISQCRQIDIYSHIRKLSHLLSLDNLKQKTVEQFCGIEREDIHSGGELIETYKEYIIKYKLAKHNAATAALSSLLLHNKDDVTALPLIFPMLWYNSLLHINECNDIQLSDITIDNSYVKYTLKSAISYPGRLSFNHNSIALNISDYTITCVIPIINDTLKHFYADYKNYYYIPAEDRAIHKSIAEYVDSSSKEKAHKDNCYTKKDGYFIPYYDETKYPCFKYEYNDKLFYIQYDEECLSNKTFVRTYIQDIINSMLNN